MSIERNEIYQGFRNARSMVRQIVAGRENQLQIGSDPGFGKTWLVHDECRRAGIKSQVVQFTSDFNAGYKQFWDTRNLDVVIIDDSEALARTESLASLAKMAFGPTRECRSNGVQYRTNEFRRTSDDEKQQNKYDPSLPPPMFKYRARPVWLSNINYSIAENIHPNMRPHFRALASRGFQPLWIDCSDPDERFEYTVWLASDGGMLRAAGYSKIMSQRILDWFFTNASRLKEVSPRSLIGIAHTFADGRSDEDRTYALEARCHKTKRTRITRYDLSSYHTLTRAHEKDRVVRIIPPSKRGQAKPSPAPQSDPDPKPPPQD